MQVHYSKVHKDLSTPREWRKCFVQQFNRGGGSRKYWEVSRGHQQPHSRPEDPFRHLREEMEVANTDHTHSVDIRNVTPWLRITGWHHYVAPHSASELCRLASTPRNTDALLPGLNAAVKEYFAQAADLLRQTNTLILQNLATSDPAKTGISNTPLRKVQYQTTLDQYSLQATSLIAMLLRPSPQGYTIAITEPLRKALDDLRSSLVSQEDVLLHIHPVLMALWTQEWVATENNPIPCPTIQYLALVTLKPDGTHAEPQAVTPIIAKLTYCIRLAFLREIKNLTLASGEATDTNACDAMARWFREKVESPFNSLKSLQHFATDQAMRTMSLPRIWWLDRENYTSMLYRGDKITVDQTKEMFWTMEEQMVTKWEQKVMLGLDLQIHYDTIQDDASNRSLGYSFLTDLRNPQFHHQHRLRDAILADATLCRQFTVYRNGRQTWNRTALQAWLWDYADFLAIVLLRCEMLSGAPSRGTEITPMTFCNVKTQDIRNLCILGKHVTILRDYHKGTQMTGHNKLIPHALDAVTSDMIIQALACAHPFAASIASLCFPDKPEVITMYKQHLFVNHHKLFESGDISHLMSDYSTAIMGWGIGINSWRHISTGFKRQLCHFNEDFLDNQEDTAEALQAGHSLNTENRIYGISADTLPSAAEDVMPIFLNVSTRWQTAFLTVPGGLMLPYKEARSHNF
ncbi:hypothetical protein BV22DRAFT_1026593, partial [Leucogyrophana mollusca]